jgi:hypothetical protein
MGLMHEAEPTGEQRATQMTTVIAFEAVLPQRSIFEAVAHCYCAAAC